MKNNTISLILPFLLIFLSTNLLYSYSTVLIDPGHGGTDMGAYSAVEGVYEKEINLQVILKLYNAYYSESLVGIDSFGDYHHRSQYRDHQE